MIYNDINLGYLAPIAETKFKQGNARFIQLNGTTSESSDFQGKIDPGTYVYVDDKTSASRNIAGKQNT